MEKSSLESKYDAEVVLPWPPSVNKTWSLKSKKGNPGLFLSKSSKNYREEVLLAVRQARIKSFKSWLSVRIDAYPPDRRRRDVDNLLKNIFDALQYADVVDDDYRFHTVFIQRHLTVVKGGEVCVRIKQVSPIDVTGGLV